MSPVLLFSLFALAVSLWAAWFGWYLRRSADTGSRTYARQYARLQRRQARRAGRVLAGKEKNE